MKRRLWPLVLLTTVASFGLPRVWAEGDLNVARGVLKAEQEAVLSSPISARITDMPLREGDRFAKGALLVSFDCGRLTAELSAARAGAAAEARNSDVQDELLRMGATGRADADIAKFKGQERSAQARAIEQSMLGCKVLAPFSGRVVETLARTSETPPANEPLIHIVSDGPLELHMVVPSRWLRWLKNGSTVAFTVDETGDTLNAKVSRVSAAVDPVSQTIKVISTVADVPAQVLPGMSGQSSMNALTAVTPESESSP